MNSRLVVFGVLVASLSGPAHGQVPREVVARAVQAMGGEPALRALTSVTTEYYGMTFALGQSETAESPPRASAVSGQITTDWRGVRRVWIQETRTVAGQVNRTRRVTAGGIGLVDVGGRLAADNPGAVANVERTLRREPERLLLTALDNPAALKALPPRTFRGESHDGVGFTLGPDTLSLYFDRRSGLLTVVETIADDPILGDRSTTTWYTRWQPTGGVRLPRQIDVLVNGQVQQHLVVTSVAVGAPLDETAFAIPDSIARSAPGAPAAPPPVVVHLAELGPGVWRAEGGTHHTLVVEQPGRLVIVEAPQSRRRMEAVLETLRARFPNKRVGVAVNTHHHWDHAGGLRTAMAAGIPVATHARNAAFIRQIAAAPKTIEPDELSRRPHAPVLQLLEDSLAIGTGETRVLVYTLPTVHAEGLVAVWVPSARVLFTSDVLTPGMTLNPVGCAELVAFARRRGLTPSQYAGGHGAVVPWADVERAAGG